MPATPTPLFITLHHMPVLPRRYLFAITLLIAFFAAGRAFHIFRRALI